jgi:hypothetical protein
VYIDVLRISTLELTLSFMPAPFQPDPGAANRPEGRAVLLWACQANKRLVGPILAQRFQLPACPPTLPCLATTTSPFTPLQATRACWRCSACCPWQTWKRLACGWGLWSCATHSWAPQPWRSCCRHVLGRGLGNIEAPAGGRWLMLLNENCMHAQQQQNLLSVPYFCTVLPPRLPFRPPPCCLQRHYTRALLPELYKVVGSASVFGDPVRLFHHLGLGVWSFLASPAAGGVGQAAQSRAEQTTDSSSGLEEACAASARPVFRF